jgi:hypothetical protein
LIDFLNLDRVLENLEPQETLESDGRRVEIERWFDPVSRRVNKRIRMTDSRGRGRVFLESVRGYRLDEVTIGLGWAGLELLDTFGNFQGDPYQRDSQRLILVGRKPP